MEYELQAMLDYITEALKEEDSVELLLAGTAPVQVKAVHTEPHLPGLAICTTDRGEEIAVRISSIQGARAILGFSGGIVVTED